MRASGNQRRVAVLLAAGFFFGPALAYGIGFRPAAIENRPLTARPALANGWGFFDQATRWATDHLPLRDKAVHGNVSLSERVFGQPPQYGSNDTGPLGGAVVGSQTGQPQQNGPAYPRLIQGTDGWLYFGGDVIGPCTPVLPVPEVLGRINRLAAAVEKSGRRFVFTIAPDKSTVWPANLPAGYLGKDCSTTRRDQFWAAVRATPPSGYFDMRGVVEARQQRTGKAEYWPSDTHWGPWSAETYSLEMARRIDPGAFTETLPSIGCVGTTTHVGDLGVLLGHRQQDTQPNCRFASATAPGGYVAPVESSPDGKPLPGFGNVPTHVDGTYSAKTGLPVARTRAVLFGDSFSSIARTSLLLLFNNLTLMHNEAANAFPDAVAQQMVDSDVVAYEIVERTVDQGNPALLSDKALAAVETKLAANPRRGS
jgi:alginate O-acetyltransferase complex protein AlgJ